MSDSSGYDPLNYGIRDAFQARNAQEFQLKMLENAVQYQPGNHDAMKTETVYADNEPLYTYPAGMFGYTPLNGNWAYVAKYVQDILGPDFIARERYDAFSCEHVVGVFKYIDDMWAEYLRIHYSNDEWDTLCALDIVNKVLKAQIERSPQKIQPIEPAEPKIMKCKVCGGPMEAPYTLCKFCGQTYRIVG